MNSLRAKLSCAALVGFVGIAAADDPLNYPVAMVRAVLKSDAPRLNTTSKRQALNLGTAFLVDLGDGNRRWMITCAHVVKHADAVRLDFSKYEWATALRVYIDEGTDLALLEMDTDAPPTLKPLKIRDKEIGADEKLFSVIGFARGVGPHKTKVPANLQGRIPGASVGLQNTDLKFDKDAVCYEVGVVGEEGSSGSAMVDRDNQLVGVYFAGWNGKSPIGYCSSSGRIKKLNTLSALPFNPNPSISLKDMYNYEAFSLRHISAYPHSRNLPANAPTSTIVLGSIRSDAVYEKFFKTNDSKLNEFTRTMVGDALGGKSYTFNHVVNAEVGMGCLVPEGYQLAERIDEESEGYSLSILRPKSLCKVRIYSRRLPTLPNERSQDETFYAQEIATFTTDVLRIAAVPPGTKASRPGESEVAVGSWPALYRSKNHGCLQSFRAYIEPSKLLIHAYSFELCRSVGSFQVAGMSYPLSGLGDRNYSDELRELNFILLSLYDYHLGIERSKQMGDQDMTVVRQLYVPGMPSVQPGGRIPYGFLAIPPIPSAGGPFPPPGPQVPPSPFPQMPIVP